jgi:formylmethanofuran dehydrogenase subunit E
MENLQDLLNQTAARHHHLCPRQVLGVRMGLLAGKVLSLDLPQTEKRLFAFVECDGCGNGGISISTGCWVDRRTLRVMDYGKLAATFVDAWTGRAIRIWPKPDSRERAAQNGVNHLDRWHKQLQAYQVLPDEELFNIHLVQLTISLEKIISQPGLTVICDRCGEEITNEREICQGGEILCRACAGDSYYAPFAQQITQPSRLNPRPSSNRKQEQANNPPIPIVSFIGRSGAGKTTLMEKLVRELIGRGYNLATIKHHSHAGFEIDVPGKDSWRFARAGSQHVIIAAPDKIASYRLLDHSLELDEIVDEIAGVDLILVEGYKQANKPAIEVVREANSTELICTSRQRIAIAADFPLELGVPQFKLDDVVEIADLIEQRFLTTPSATVQARRDSVNLIQVCARSY